MTDDAYFTLPPPKSTGKEYFNLEYVQRRLHGAELSPEDLLASVTTATAEIVAAALRPYAVVDLLVAGGGTRNPTLMGELQAQLPGVTIRQTDDLGVPEAGKEALVFAIIGFLTLCGLPATIPSCTGARHSSVLGTVTPGRRLPPQPSPPPRPPSRLVVRPGRP